MKNRDSRTLSEVKRFLSRALTLARRGLGRTDPNPMVGAVLVQGDSIVGQGYHRAVGLPHAEVMAIKDAGEKARGADMFVTLEPCNHHGRTPPCTHAIIEAGIRRVWYGIEDPNPEVSGGGAETLRAAGVEVVGKVMEHPCRRLNEVYLTHITRRRPFVFLKLAMSLDGRIATRTGQSRWITSDASRRHVHRLRDRVSAVMVGIGTLLADNPSLTTRLPRGRGHDPTRIIADSDLRTPLDSEVFNPSSPAGVIIASRKDPPASRMTLLKEKGARIFPTEGIKQVDLHDLLARLYAVGITSVLIEGGAGLAWGALQAEVVDRCLFFYSPMIIGGETAPSGVGGTGISRLEDAPRLTDFEIRRTGPDILVSGRVQYRNPVKGEAPSGHR